MIIIKLMGGLGNQLFQYAAARTLSFKHNVPLLVDASDYNQTSFRKLDLDLFKLKYKEASKEEINSLLPKNNLQKVIQYIQPKSKRTYHREHFFNYDKSFENIGSNVYLKGYFQSEKYFKEIENIIRNEFVVEDSFIVNVQNIANEISSCNSVSVHIRRGDYTNKGASDMHGILPAEYYKSAIDILEQKPDNFHYYIFSDDINWVADNFKLNNATCVSGKHSSNYIEDFYLMSQCKHNIIANSSFSWWAAWLNQNQNKIVVAPKQWFKRGIKNFNDIYAGGWLKV